MPKKYREQIYAVFQSKYQEEHRYTPSFDVIMSQMKNTGMTGKALSRYREIATHHVNSFKEMALVVPEKASRKRKTPSSSTDRPKSPKIRRVEESSDDQDDGSHDNDDDETAQKAGIAMATFTPKFSAILRDDFGLPVDHNELTEEQRDEKTAEARDKLLELIECEQQAATSEIQDISFAMSAMMIKAVNGGVSKYLDKFPASITEAATAIDPRIQNASIDAVITFVNDRDQSWQKERTKYEEAIKTSVADEAVAARRFQSTDEVLYAIKSIKTFAPWINRIYLVVATLQQVDAAIVPPELRQFIDDGIVKPIVHKDIMPSTAVPTFNSNVIDAHLHCIPGLSKFFIKFDDDVMLSRPAAKSDFLSILKDKVVPRISFKARPLPSPNDKQPNKSLYFRTTVRNRHLIDKLPQNTAGQAVPMRFLTHGPQILETATVATAAKKFENQITAMHQNRFRDESDIMLTSLLAQHFALAHGKATYEFDTADSFVYVCVSDWHRDMAQNMASILSSPPKSFCVNNSTQEGKEKSLEVLKKFLADFDK